MFERFTDRARKVMALARQEAQRFNHDYVGPEHVLLALTKDGAGAGANCLKSVYDIDLPKVRIEVEKRVKIGSETATQGKLPQTEETKSLISQAIESARDMNHNYVGTEHILCAYGALGEGIATEVLQALGVKASDLQQDVTSYLVDHPSKKTVPLRPQGLEQLLGKQCMVVYEAIPTGQGPPFVSRRDRESAYQTLRAIVRGSDEKYLYVTDLPMKQGLFDNLLDDNSHIGTIALNHNLIAAIAELKEKPKEK